MDRTSRALHAGASVLVLGIGICIGLLAAPYLPISWIHAAEAPTPTLPPPICWVPTATDTPTITPTATATATSTATPTDTPTVTPSPTPEAWTFAVAGDMQIAQTWCRSVDLPGAVRESGAELVLIAGDLVDHGREGYACFERCYADVLHLVLPCPGNHDIYLNGAPYERFAARQLDTFARREGAKILLREPRLYVAQYRNLAIVSLPWFPWNAPKAKVEQALQLAQAAEHIVVIMHRPVYSSLWKNADARHAPLFRKYGVDIVFTGHVHAYECIDGDEVRYVTTGGAGGKLRPDHHHHIVVVRVDGELEMEVKYL